MTGSNLPPGEQFHDGKVVLWRGDCLDLLPTIASESVDAVVTDPPYGLEFMSKDWDGADGFRRSLNKADVGRDNAFGRLSSRGPEYRTSGLFQTWCEAWARECLRVLKPGAHLVAFGGTRTYHRLACAIEDAGFEIRDQLAWVYGQGFPKSLDVSKAIDKEAGIEREDLGASPNWRDSKRDREKNGSMEVRGKNAGRIMIPSSDAARQWQGWGTALKPAWEPIVLARKPLIGTVADNVLKHGTGALNIDGTRIEATESTERLSGINDNVYGADNRHGMIRGSNLGRWPANLIHDGSDEVLAGFPETQSGNRSGEYDNGTFSSGLVTKDLIGDSGSAARFFYTAKADNDERLGSKHPTVKPLDLMQYLVRLVTPKDGVVLDPFAGTGTTGEAALHEGMKAVLIERESEYQADIVRRMELFGSSQMTRKVESLKAKGKIETDLGPLFGGEAS